MLKKNATVSIKMQGFYGEAASHALGECGYDGEHNHRLCRDVLGIRSSIIKLNPRNGLRKAPAGKYRAQLWRRFPRQLYGQRWLIESAFSRNKRLLGQALRARSTQSRECLLRVLVHNLMILRLFLSFSTEQNRLLRNRLCL